MEPYLLWFGFSVLCGIVGASRGRSGFLVFLAAVFLSPLLTLIYVLAVPKKSEDEAAIGQSSAVDMACPQCAETIKRAAKVCRFCGYDLETYHAEQVGKRGSPEWTEERFERWLRELSPPIIDPTPEDRKMWRQSFLWKLKNNEIDD